MPKASERLPQIKHPYQNHSMDNLRWNFFTPRADNIVVATSYKAGTTWVQAIVGDLIFTGQRLPGSIDEMSPSARQPLVSSRTRAHGTPTPDSSPLDQDTPASRQLAL